MFLIQLAKIVQQASGADATTSLQHEVNRFIAIISSFAVITAFVIVLYWVFYLRITYRGFMNLSMMLGNVIGIVVAYVPDGFPLALSLGLTIIAKRLCSKYHVLAKRLGCIETLGSISILCSDKTGTLTQNLMTVTMLLSAADVKRFRNDQEQKRFTDGTTESAVEETEKGGIEMGTIVVVPEVSRVPEAIRSNSAVVMTGGSGVIETLSHRIAVLCNQAKMQKPRSSSTDEEQITGAAGGFSSIPSASSELDLEAAVGGAADEKPVAVGSNSTDRAILNWANDNTDLSGITSLYEVRAQVPFSSATKTATVVVADRRSEQSFVLFKGAPEYILPNCANYVNEKGEICVMTPYFSAQLTSLLSVEANKGRRIIALVQFGPLPVDQYPPEYEYTCDPVPNFPTAHLTFVSCVVVSDPPRVNVDTAISALRAAGTSNDCL